MNAEQTIEEAFLSPVQAATPTTWKIGIEPSNIISLAEQGLLHSPKPEDTFEEEDLAYQRYSPLNEW